jgi:hypothetical protein
MKKTTVSSSFQDVTKPKFSTLNQQVKGFVKQGQTRASIGTGRFPPHFFFLNSLITKAFQTFPHLFSQGSLCYQSFPEFNSMIQETFVSIEILFYLTI